MVREAVILAGGFGTRLKDVLKKNTPKPMAPIHSRPFLEYILDNLVQFNFTKVVLSVGYLHEVIINHFGSEYKNLKIEYMIENSPLGTGGALLKSLEKVRSNEIFVLNGDTFFNIDFDGSSLNQESSLCLALKNIDNASRYGSVLIDTNGIVQEFKEKESNSWGLINGGIYLVRRDIFSDIKILEEKFSFEVFMKKYYKNIKASAKVFDDYFIDIGVPEDYKLAENYFLN